MFKGRKGDKNKVQPSINLWQVERSFVTALKDKNVPLMKNELLYLIKIDGDLLYFKTEKLFNVVFHKEILKLDKIIKVYP